MKAQEQDERQQAAEEVQGAAPAAGLVAPSAAPAAAAPAYAHVLALQRSAGNQAVARQFGPAGPGGPGGPMQALGQMLYKTPLERVKDKLEYGVTDFAVTNEDAADATRILSDMSDADLTSAVASLDASETPYLDRLVNNAPLATVRHYGFGKIMKKRSPARNKALAESLVSYGFFDWEINPAEAEAAQTLLDALPEADRDKLTEEWMRKRISENLALPGDYEEGVGEQLLDGALKGDFNEDPTFWNVCGQIAVGFVPYAGQVADIRDLIAALDDMFDKGGYKKVTSWINLILTIIGFVPGVGDAVKALGKGALKAIKKAGITVGGALWDLARKHLLDPVVKHLFPEALHKLKTRLKEFLEERMRKAVAHGPDAPNVETGGGHAGTGAADDAAGGIAKLGEQTDTAFREAAAQAPRRMGDIIGELVHETIDELKRWADRAFKQLEFEGIGIELTGDELIVYGIASRHNLFKVNIKGVKEDIVVRRGPVLMEKIKKWEDALEAARAAAKAIANDLRKQARFLSEEIGERVGEILIKGKFPNAKVRYRGPGARNRLDRVLEEADVLHIVECKGGAGRFIDREVKGGLRAMQGSTANLLGVLEDMAASGDKEAVEIANDILKRLRSKPSSVRFWGAETNELSSAAEEKLVATLTEFAIGPLK